MQIKFWLIYFCLNLVKANSNLYIQNYNHLTTFLTTTQHDRVLRILIDYSSDTSIISRVHRKWNNLATGLAESKKKTQKMK